MSENVSVQSAKSKRCSCGQFLKTILTALPSIIFGLFTIMFSLQQNSVAQKNREQDQRQSDERSMRTTFENYIEDISSLLLSRKFNRNNSEHLLHIRVKTLTTLRYVDAARSRDIIQFLYESRLLRTNLPKELQLNLTGADLSDVQFIGLSSRPLDLRYLNLAGVYAPNIVFKRCNLQEASFDDAVLTNAKFISVTMHHASFRSIYAPDMTMSEILFYGNDFQNSIIHRVRLSDINVYGSFNLTNADWYGNATYLDLSAQWSILYNPNVIRQNAHLPDGSYGPINDRNLIRNGGAEEACSNNQTSTDWFAREFPLMEFLPTKNLTDVVDKETLDDCVFVAQTLNVSLLSQIINVESFSVLIDDHRAAYNLSARLGCYGSAGNMILLGVLFIRESLLQIDADQKVNATEEPRQWNSLFGRIPAETRALEVVLGAIIHNSSGFCLADNLRLNIFKI